ncbi:ATP-grasp domain-containing protein [Cognatiyoonia sp. IB215446]|uniref:ATP-grasp domain-containing protein n=1 Tax=Cognatiyoonia sp. IB215446 TaxID=3097355 RepID=UPI002A157D61|nr:ATP-grasp domain-containing protein [Cognatiyoonia sp. IB215446]MDX8349286.1 ATP-grasp domain-containing protein [Cognatiyoonia sp. IB215446]
MARILFTGGGGAGNEALYRYLGEKHELYFADADITSISPMIPVDRRFEIPWANDPDFCDVVMELCTSRGMDYLVPGVDEELAQLASYKNGSVQILVPQREFVEEMLDKYGFAMALAKAGLPVPETRLLHDCDGMDFPLIAKPRSGRGSRAVARVESPAQIDAYLILQGKPGSEYVAQAIAPGHEYTVCVHADSTGELQTVVPVKVGIKRGITLSATAKASTPIYNYVKAFQQKFRPQGIYNIQCMMDEHGNVSPFEVNPRVSTTFCLALQAGFDPFDHQSTPPKGCIPQSPIHLRRHWANFITSERAAE